MSTLRTAYTGARLFDGLRFQEDTVLVTEDGLVRDLCSKDDIPAGCELVKLDGGILSPGFVDLQVNGGGGVMFNSAPAPDTLRRMARAHRTLGATTILPTLITDTPEVTRSAINAAVSAVEQGVSGIAGLHLEGPHLCPQRKGAHEAAFIRPMTEGDLSLYVETAQRLPALKITLAPERASCEQIKRLTAAGVVVSLGHTNASFDLCRQAAEAGAQCVTHLFNAQSQLGNREPGVVGAALSLGQLSAGMIADGIHVHPATMRAALNAKEKPGQIFLVSDAMATAGSDISSFELNGRTIQRSGDRLTLADGTLAGAHLDLATAIRNVVTLCGRPLDQALAMATGVPAALIGQPARLGRFVPGARANWVHLSSDLELLAVGPED